VKLSTASTRRAVDKWKGKIADRAEKFQLWTFGLAAALLASQNARRGLLLPFLIFAMSLNFAAFELGALFLAGFFVAKLHCYRFANSVFRLISFG
jgi:hypothetical protein